MKKYKLPQDYWKVYSTGWIEAIKNKKFKKGPGLEKPGRYRSYPLKKKLVKLVVHSRIIGILLEGVHMKIFGSINLMSEISRT